MQEQELDVLSTPSQICPLWLAFTTLTISFWKNYYAFNMFMLTLTLEDLHLLILKARCKINLHNSGKRIGVAILFFSIFI